ncbi:Integral membrane protein [Borrelia nietonii YOR]|uniref:Integral membrane protein n=1 Tax=Borrelia nietonii YOR TaxID=1293576 RepID=A0ABM5PIR9_9SPIR|nr:Integral membrane protein [Borrelia nietonii YOR]
MISVYIKGLLIGIASIIPGVSGGTLALILGIYYNIIHSSANLIKLKRVKESIIFIGILSLGILTSATILAKIFKKLYLRWSNKRNVLKCAFYRINHRKHINIKKRNKYKKK